MHKLLLGAASMLVFSSALAFAQSTPLVYAIQTRAKNGCPGIALHLDVYAKTIKGFAASGDMNAMSTVTGTRNGLGHFDMTMTPVSPDGPKGTIIGDANQQNTTIRARISGSGCSDGPISITSLRITDAK
jgi:hypothetical protein